MRGPTITQRVVFFTCFLTLLIIVIGLFVIYPAVKQIRSLRKSVAETQAVLEQDYQKTLLLRRSIRELDSIDRQTRVFEGATITNGDELRVITELENLASTYTIDQTLHVTYTDPKNIPPAQRPKQASPVNLPFYTFSFLNHGTFDQHIAYLESLSRLPYYVLIDQMQWEQRGGGDLVTVRFDGKVYASPST